MTIDNHYYSVMIWPEKPIRPFTIFYLAHAVEGNFTSNQTEMKKTVLVGLALDHGIKPDKILKDKKSIDILGDDPNFKRLKKEYDEMKAYGHKYYDELRTKTGIVCNTANFFLLETSKCKTI